MRRVARAMPADRPQDNLLYPKQGVIRFSGRVNQHDNTLTNTHCNGKG